MLSTKANRLIPLVGIATLVVVLGACGSTEEVDVGPTPTTAAIQQPAPAATAAPGAPAAPAATAVPGATAAPQPTAAPAGEPKYGGIFIVSNRGDPPGWDPMFTGTITLHAVAGSMYGDANLVKPCREDTYIICGGLASKWEPNADLSVWTFTIRDGVLWHDGTPFTIDDAKFWFDLTLKGAGETRRPSSLAGDLTMVDSVEIVGGNKLQVNLNASTPLFPDVLAGPRDEVAHPKHLMQQEIDKGNATVSPEEVGWVATGPFEMERYRKGSVIRVRRFEKYWEKDDKGRQLPYLDGIDFAIIGDAHTMVAAFRAGRIDATTRGGGFGLLPQQQRAITKDLGDMALYGRVSGPTRTLTFNIQREGPWQDVRVRKAVSYWIDRAGAVEAVTGGNSEVNGVFSPGSPWQHPDLFTWPGYNPETREQDRARAKELLAEAGFPNGFKLSLLCRDRWIPTCEYHDAQLKALGLDMSIDVVDTATRDQRICDQDYEFLLFGPSTPIPEGWGGVFDVTNPCGDASTHKDSRVTELFAELTAARDAEARNKAAHAIEEYVLLENVYVIPIKNNVDVFGYRDYVKGMNVPKADWGNNTDFSTIWLEK